MLSNAVRITASRLSSRCFSALASNKAASSAMLVNFGSSNNATSAPVAMQLQRFSSQPPAFLDSAEVMDRIVSVVKNFDQVDPSKVNSNVKFVDDLGLDSLDIVEVVMAIEDEFAIEIPDQEADKIMSIQDAVDYISTHPNAK